MKKILNIRLPLLLALSAFLIASPKAFATKTGFILAFLLAAPFIAIITRTLEPSGNTQQ